MTDNLAARRTNLVTSVIFLRLIIVLAGGVALFLCSMLTFEVVRSISYAGRIYPGISIGGVDLSGLTREEAATALLQHLTYPQTGLIAFQYDGKTWAARPAELGAYFDSSTNALAAYQLGRSGNFLARLYHQLRTWHAGEDLALVITLDQAVARRFLEGIAEQVNTPTLDASLRFDGGQVVAVPGLVGRKVDIEANLALLEDQLRSLTDGIIPLVVQEIPPQIMDVSEEVQTAQKMLSAPLTLHIADAKGGDAGPWVIPPDQLAKMLTVERVQASDNAKYQVKLDDEALSAYLSGLVEDIDRQPANARFIFNDETRLLELIQPAVIGRSLDIPATIQEINQRLLRGEHTVPLSLTYTQPEIGDDATGEQLGIRELIVAYTSYFRGSTPERMQNIKTASANFHGLLVPPGATFSMVSVLGTVSLDTGYAEALIIYGDRTIKGVGGGVCQVSTTLFRAAFFAGFPIVERHPHAYRVGYYEQTATGTDEDLAGLDATVFVPMVDFKFINDTPYWLLMETYFNEARRSLTWKFYSTSDGRKVEWQTSGPKNKVDPPEPVYEENPELEKGEIKQVDWAAEGADVTVTRTVYRNGEVLFSDTFITHYLPWGDVYQYGPGTKLPKKKQQRLNP